MGRFVLCYGPFWLYDGPFWTTQRAVLDNFLGIKIFGAVLAMGRFGIVPFHQTQHKLLRSRRPTPFTCFNNNNSNNNNNNKKIKIIIIINNSKTMFMVLSSWQSHCERSPSSSDERRMAPSGSRNKTKPDDLGCKSA